MFGLVWGIITLPFTIVGFVFKLVVLAVIVAIVTGGYFVGNYVGWDRIFTFVREIVNK